MTMRSTPEFEGALSRRGFLSSAGLAGVSLAAFSLPSYGDEPRPAAEPERRSLRLSTGRAMSYRLIGRGETDLILVHGFPGSSRQFLSFEKFLTESGICALAPDLYGKHTDWDKRRSVADAGVDIAELYLAVRGKDRIPAVLCVSGGAKDGIAATAALNQRLGGRKVAHLCTASGLGDLANPKLFSQLPADQQFEFNCIRGVSKRAALRVFQPVRNLGARLRQSVAHRRVNDLSRNPDAAFERVIGAMSPTEDLPLLRKDESFRNDLKQEIAEYTGPEIIDSVHRMFHWNLDFRQLRGTSVSIVHGTKDCMVSPKNAETLKSELTRAGVSVSLQYYPDGHLLVKRRANEIAALLQREMQPESVVIAER